MPAHLSQVATLIAAERLESGMISDACDRLTAVGLDVAEIEWIDSGVALDIGFTGDANAARAALAPLQDQVDVAVQSGNSRRKMLLVSDMDSTMITVECIDELADYAGIKPQIAEITERAMQGELDFATALKERVTLLAGLDEQIVQTCLDERVRPMAGAQTLVRTMASWGAHSVLVSGGFTSFAVPVAKMIGLSESHANLLEIANGKLTGRLLGDIVDAAAKKKILLASASSRGVKGEEILAVGDGANDLPMIAAAMDSGGLGVAFHAKPVVAEASSLAVRHGDLTTLLYAQGVPRSNWVV